MENKEIKLGILSNVLDMFLRNDRDLIIPLINEHLKAGIEKVSMNSYPVTVPNVMIYGTKYFLATIDQIELEIFRNFFIYLIGTPTSEELYLMLTRYETYLIGLRAMKEFLYGVRFSGVSTYDTELGIAVLAPREFEVGRKYQLSKDLGLIVTHVKIANGQKQTIVPIPTIIQLPGTTFGLAYDAGQGEKVTPGGMIFGLGRALKATEWGRTVDRI